MNMSKNQKIIVGIISVLVLLSIYIAIDLRSKRSGDNVEVVEKTATTTKIQVGDLIIDTGGTGSYQVERVPVNEGREPVREIAKPSLSREVVFNASLNLSEEAKKAIVDKINSIKEGIKTEPTDLSQWIDLGLYHKMAGDYTGAAIYWKYVGEVADKDFISYGNLGNLYAYYLKDNGMAETYYLKAISNGPKQAYLYVQLADVYKDVFGDKNKALAIVDKGLLAIPGNETLSEYKKNLQ